MADQPNTRKDALTLITRKLAQFIVSHTYADESDARRHLYHALGEMARAEALIVATDAEEAQTVKDGPVATR